MSGDNALAIQRVDGEDVIRIRATAKRNGLTTLLVGLAGFFVAYAVIGLLPESFFLFGIMITSASIVALLIGYFKIREPAHSMELDKQQMIYKHRHGQWTVDWDNIQRIDVPRVFEGLEHKDLNIIGIRLKDYAPLLDSISPRLATNILMEQRPLLLQNRDPNCASGTCFGDDLIESDRFKLSDGTAIRGIKAMLANRMTKLREQLGYDLYISASELDRQAGEFVQLLRDCQNRVQQESVQQQDS
ncbi:DUF2982 domain-containing protein [Aestuariibacter salexigens]|uniref:DUF2982 domain-containing protein n=1 Tax=Aestuariibacter salexigens TaxID=226010 RepID=UPI00041B0884|nr:DUF2982 domain-containing protein [Aestuariibacter salexigens]